MASIEKMVGKWVCSEVSPNMGAFMEKTGAPWIARTAASAAGFGKGSAKQTITKDGELVTITTEGARTITTTVSLNGQSGQSDTPLGTATVTATVNDNGELHILALKDGKEIKMSHKLESDTVRIQNMSLDGVDAWRRWTRTA
eukprot:c22950_g1_i1.p1 GENE.c22950_g1_i1~~c22950_g1_i1.p1  ORF type:complete len:155 (+),score=43.03 c22950_g1_i1:39-467(+)